MATLSVNVRRVALESDLETDLRRAKALATLLDAQFNILGFKFGLDPIVDLIPVAGDTIMFLAGLYPVYVARKHKLGKGVERRMIANLIIDWLIGLFPVIGAVFDAAYRANLKNVDLLEKAAAKRR
jgi:hypothetical protein